MVKVKIAGTNKQEPQPGQSKGARKLRETKRMEIRIPQFQKEKKKDTMLHQNLNFMNK